MYEFSELIERVDGFNGMPQQQQVKMMAFFYTIVKSTDIFTASDLKSCFINEGLKEPSNINREFANLKSSKPPIFLKRKNGYVLERGVKKQLTEAHLGVTKMREISHALRLLPPKLTGSEQRGFLEECLACFEIGAYRSSIVMCWLLTIDTIYEYILVHKINDFNGAIQSHGKYKKILIAAKDDFNDIKESDFIELLRVGKIVTNDVRKILDEKLNFRNSCAHPNSVIIKDNKAIAFIEDLVENVILRFCN